MKLTFITKNKIIIFALLIALIGIILCFYISPTYPMQILQNYMNDSYFKLKNKFVKNKEIKNNNTILVTIDEESLKNYVENKYIKWPWPRKLYAQISQYLIDKGAKAVIFNINFSIPDLDHHGIPGYGEINDNRFYNIIYNTNKVIIPFEIDLNSKSNKELNTLKIKNINDFKNIKNYTSLIPPYSMYTINNNNFGFTDIEKDTDNKIRNYIPFIKINNDNYPSLATATYLLLNNTELPNSLHLNKNGSFKLNFYSNNEIFKKLSFYSILSDYINELNGIPIEIPENTYKDKIFFIGPTSKIINMQQNIQISNREAYPYIEIHALAYQNLVNKDWIKNFPYYIEFPFYFILMYLLVFLGIKIRPKLLYIFFYLFIFISLYTLNFYFFVNLSTISNNIIFTTLFILLFYFIIQFFKYITNKNKKGEYKKSTSSHLNQNLLKKAKNTDKKLLKETKNITVSVLFIELDNFSKYVNNNESEKIFEILNIYFRKFTEIIIKNKGFIYKFLENEIIVLFGVPDVLDDHADMAVKTAFDCYNISKDLFASYNLNIRIGISSGEINFTGLDVYNKNIEYIAIGNPLKISNKLKNLNKIFDTNILIGKETKALLKNVYSLDYLGEFILNQNENLFEIYYFKEAIKQQKERFKLMANAYENNDINSFKRFISYFLENSTDFGPALFYIKHHKNNEKKFGEPIDLINNLKN